MNSSHKTIAVGPGFSNEWDTNPCLTSLRVPCFFVWFDFFSFVCVCCNRALFIDTEIQILCNFHVTKYHYSFDFFPIFFSCSFKKKIEVWMPYSVFSVIQQSEAAVRIHISLPSSLPTHSHPSIHVGHRAPSWPRLVPCISLPAFEALGPLCRIRARVSLSHPSLFLSTEHSTGQRTALWLWMKEMERERKAWVTRGGAGWIGKSVAPFENRRCERVGELGLWGVTQDFHSDGQRGAPWNAERRAAGGGGKLLPASH